MTTRPAEAEPMMRGSWSCTDFWGSPGQNKAHRHKWVNNTRNTTWGIKGWPSLRKLEEKAEGGVRTVKTGAEVHGVAVASVSSNGASSDLHHVGGGSPQPLHLGRAVLGCDGVWHRLALKSQQRTIKAAVTSVSWCFSDSSEGESVLWFLCIMALLRDEIRQCSSYKLKVGFMSNKMQFCLEVLLLQLVLVRYEP